MPPLEAGSTVLVTGAAGFIGSHASEALLRRGCDVVGVDNFDAFYDRALKERNADAVRETARVTGRSFTLIEADLAEDGVASGAIVRSKPDAVLHLAAKAGVRPSIEDPAGYVRANVLATQLLLNASAEAERVGRFVMASSSSVYGNNKTVPFSEEHDVSFPISPYAATKRACELIAHTHHHLTGMPTSCLRFFTVYGPRQRPDLAIAKFLRLVSAGEPIRMFGDGTTSRDYTFIDDIVAGVLAAIDRTPDFGYRVWNLGNSSPVSLAEMIATIERVVGREAVINREPMQPGDVERTYADVTRSAAELGYEPATSLREGMAAQLEASLASHGA